MNNKRIVGGDYMGIKKEYLGKFKQIWEGIIGKFLSIINSSLLKKVCGPQKGYGEKRCEIQGGGQEMAVMVG